MDGVKAVKRHNAQYDLFNRLHSIASDQEFVKEVSEKWYEGRFEVVPNQRCGTWYCPPTTTYAYFKSTDGHTSVRSQGPHSGQADMIELELQPPSCQSVARIICRGSCWVNIKDLDIGRFNTTGQDALSKTIPIWCSVINRAVARHYPSKHQGTEWDELYLPAGVVSPSEREQIIALLPTWTEALLASGLSLPSLQRPLRPFFLHPSTSSPPHIPRDPAYTPIICLSVSRWVGITGQQGDDVPSVTRVGIRNVGYEYVPGAGDDDELWAKGLTPGMFWKHADELLRMDRSDLDAGVQAIKEDTDSLETGVKGLQLGEGVDQPTRKKALTGVPTSTSNLAVDLGKPVVSVSDWSATNSCRTISLWVVEVNKAQTYPETVYTHPKRHEEIRHIGLALPSPKGDSWAYKAALAKLLTLLETTDDCNLIVRPAASDHLDLLMNPPKDDFESALESLDVHQDEVSNRKTIIPILLLLLCSFPHLCEAARADGKLDKGRISGVLLSLVGLWPNGNPPRAALKRVNEILLGSGKP